MTQERVEIVMSVPRRSPPLSIRIMRGGRLVHVFDEPEPSAQPEDPQAEA